MGVQVCDPAGRVQCIIPTPNGKVANLALGGPGLDTLYALCGDKLYKRKMLAKAAPSFQPPLPTKQNGG
jgi:sugar lactone lactonase YvrE